MIVAGVLVESRWHPGLLQRAVEAGGELQRHRFIVGAVMQLNGAGGVGDIVDRRNRIPERGILLRRAKAFDQILTPAPRARRHRDRHGAPPVVHEVIVRGHHAGPDDAGSDVIRGDHGAQRDVPAHRVAPHADALNINARVALERADGVEHIHGVIGRAVTTRGHAFRIAVAAIVRPEDDVTGAGEVIYIGHITLGRAVLLRRNIAVIEDNHRPTTGRPGAARNRQQRVNLQPFRSVGGDVTVVVTSRRQRLLQADLAAGITPLAHHFDHQGMAHRRRRYSLGVGQSLSRRRGRQAGRVRQRWRRHDKQQEQRRKFFM